MSLRLLPILLVLSAPATAEQYSYEMDQNHTLIQFTWNHNGLANMSGRFTEFEGNFKLDFDDPKNSEVQFAIDANSIWTGVEKLDEDMKSQRLFDTAKFPTITFVSTKARKTGVNRGQLKGDLTIKGTTLPVTLFIDVNRQGRHHFADSVEQYKDAFSAGLTIHAKVNRSAFDLGMAVPWIADEIEIRIETELVAYVNGKPATAE